MTDFFTQTVDELIVAGVSSPRLEARMIFSHILQHPPSTIDYQCDLSIEQQTQLAEILQRRRKHEPLDKIFGYRDFYKNTFIVSDQVLSPRPDSEILVEEAIKIAKSTNAETILELGVGSGCLILSVLAECPDMIGFGIDKSPAAIDIARKNAAKLNLEKRITLQNGDYFVPTLPDKKFSLIISNPPYIASKEIESLDLEVKSFDPAIALDGGTDGLEHYRQIASVIDKCLSPDGYILLEIGVGQADAVKNIFSAKGFTLNKIVCDLAGIKRCIIFKK